MASSSLFRLCCKGFRPMLWTVSLLLTLNLLYRGLLLLEGQGTLKKHGFNFVIPKLSIRLKKPTTALVPVHHVLDNQAFCSSKPGLLAVALVPSRIEDLALRQQTRQTWGSALKENIPIGVVFLVGKTHSKEEMASVRQEHEDYQDIVQGDYADNLAASKIFSGMVWTGLKCSKVPFTIIASDKILLDVFVLKSFMEEVQTNPEHQGTIFGHLVVPESQVRQPDTWNIGHIIPEMTTPSVQVPPFFKEGAWFGRTATVLRLLGMAGNVQLISPPTAYFTGLLANAAGVKKSPMAFNSWWATGKSVKELDIGVVFGWLNEHLTLTREELWKRVTDHHATKKHTEKKLIKGPKQKKLGKKSNNPKGMLKSMPTKLSPAKKIMKPLAKNFNQPGILKSKPTKLNTAKKIKKPVKKVNKQGILKAVPNRLNSTKRKIKKPVKKIQPLNTKKIQPSKADVKKYQDERKTQLKRIIKTKNGTERRKVTDKVPP